MAKSLILVKQNDGNSSLFSTFIYQRSSPSNGSNGSKSHSGSQLKASVGGCPTPHDLGWVIAALEGDNPLVPSNATLISDVPKKLRDRGYEPLTPAETYIVKKGRGDYRLAYVQHHTGSIKT